MKKKNSIENTKLWNLDPISRQDNIGTFSTRIFLKEEEEISRNLSLKNKQINYLLVLQVYNYKHKVELS